MMSLQRQYLLCPPLVCNTARTHQQPKITSSGYFTWETRPWKQEKTTSYVRGLRRISAQTVRNRLRENGFRTHQTSLLWSSTETSASTCKGLMVQQSKELESAKLEMSLVQLWIKIHAAGKTWLYSSLGWWCGVPYPSPEKLKWCTPTATLTPLNTYMRFWHYTCFPKWTSVGTFFSTTTLGRI